MRALPSFLATVLAPSVPEGLDAWCWLRRVHERGPEYLVAIEDALGVVERRGQLPELTARARGQHPVHSVQADDRFIDVLTEACGFAWAAEVLGLSLTFTDDLGKADFAFTLGAGGEAKSVHPPPGRPCETFTSGAVIGTPAEGLIRKMTAHLAKAASQLRGDSGSGVGFVFFNVLQFANLLEDISNKEIIPALAEELSKELPNHPAIGVVAVCWNFQWRDALAVRI